MHGRNRSPGESNHLKAVFITGTDTGVGKTIVAATILSILRAGGADAVPMKPIQTGCTVRMGSLIAPDLEYCLSSACLRPTRAEKDQMSPYKFRPACSPHLAARLARKTIDPGRILDRYSALTKRHDFVVIEGAGGVLVPISHDKTMLDVIKTLAVPVILVARSGLGTINHSLLSLHRLRQAGIKVLGVVFNQSQPGRPGYIEKDNCKTVADHGKVSILGSLPFAHDIVKLHHSPAAFLRWAKAHMNLQSIYPIRPNT